MPEDRATPVSNDDLEDLLSDVCDSLHYMHEDPGHLDEETSTALRDLCRQALEAHERGDEAAARSAIDAFDALAEPIEAALMEQEKAEVAQREEQQRGVLLSTPEVLLPPMSSKAPSLEQAEAERRAAQREETIKRFCHAVHRELTEGIYGSGAVRGTWTSWRLEYRAMMGVQPERDFVVVRADGSTQPRELLNRLLGGLPAQLRVAMADSCLGWYTAIFEGDPAGNFRVRFDATSEPLWHQTVTPVEYRRDLDFWPRSKDEMPEWLRRKLDAIEPTA